MMISIILCVYIYIYIGTYRGQDRDLLLPTSETRQANLISRSGRQRRLAGALEAVHIIYIYIYIYTYTYIYIYTHIYIYIYIYV